MGHQSLSQQQQRRISGPGAARPAGPVMKGKILRKCVKCEAAPGHKCRKLLGAGGEAPYWVPLKEFHKER